MKAIAGLVIALALIGGGYYLYAQSNPMGEENQKVRPEVLEENAGKTVVQPGSYTVDAEESEFNWAAKKPLIEGYVNSGTIDLSEGAITVTDSSATGSFTIDMDTLHVGLTATKPGKEGALEKHLKTDDFFDVAKYPAATFKIKSVAANSESDATLMYAVTGDLTMHGKTNEISFPAKIYMMDGRLHATAETEIDRTKWDLKYNSGTFFDDLGNNLIDDMVAISFHLVADPN